ncbi:thermonuclease family protein [Microvirga massiliensis]|uniref:thermonuclease family protein n=1 Tax=Microvirga massiliensis TaxID=1033741 RepID=UPI00062BC0FC|nr:thermonuclease family protein [Microvirga massiliensis]
MPIFRHATYAFATSITILVSTSIATAATTTVAGIAHILDGDTIEIDGTRIRLFGIDAPEGAQRCKDRRGNEWACGRAATRALERLINGQTVTCQGDAHDDYGRLLAVCTTASGEINAALVSQGFAWAFVKYSDAYVTVEAEARKAGRGVFAVDNEPPWAFRAKKWEGATESAEADRQRKCPIKGNISRTGVRIYHLPWQASYARTTVNEKAGERWFCDEAEAERAGWRRAR